MTRKAADRMPPIPAEKMSDAQRKAVADLVAGPRGKVVGPFFVLTRSPELMGRVQQVGEYLRFNSSLPEALKELAILMTARQWSQAFEFHHHRLIGEKAGLAKALCDAVSDGRRPDTMSTDEELVHDFCIEMFRSCMSVSDVTYEKAVKRFGEQGIVDLVTTCGYYTTLAMLMNVARTPLPEGTPEPFKPFPK